MKVRYPTALFSIIFHYAGLDPSGYRGNSVLHHDENDAMLGGQAQMTDEERFKVGEECFRGFDVSGKL